MQLFIDNWRSALTLPAAAADIQLAVPEVDASRLVGLGAGDYYWLTIAIRDVSGLETAWENVRVNGYSGGLLDVERGPVALDLEAGTVISARLNKASMDALRDSITAAQASCEPVVEAMQIDSPTLVLGLEHLSRLLEFSQACVVTVPPDAAWPASAKTWLCQGAAGAVEVVEGESVTVLKPVSRQRVVAEQGAVATLMRRPGVNAWRLFGDLLPTEVAATALLAEDGTPLLTEAGEPLLTED